MSLKYYITTWALMQLEILHTNETLPNIKNRMNRGYADTDKYRQIR
jgi:hypothetical protein